MRLFPHVLSIRNFPDGWKLGLAHFVFSVVVVLVVALVVVVVAVVLYEQQ